MYIFFQKHVHLLAKTCTSFPKNMYMFWRGGAHRIFARGVAATKSGVAATKSGVAATKSGVAATKSGVEKSVCGAENRFAGEKIWIFARFHLFLTRKNYQLKQKKR